MVCVPPLVCVFTGFLFFFSIPYLIFPLSLSSLPFDLPCGPWWRARAGEYKSENLGEILRGDVIVTTPYALRMRVNSTCQLINCESSGGVESINRPKTFSKEQSQLFAQRIREEYQVHMWVGGTRFYFMSAFFSLSQMSFQVCPYILYGWLITNVIPSLSVNSLDDFLDGR